MLCQYPVFKHQFSWNCKILFAAITTGFVKDIVYIVLMALLSNLLLYIGCYFCAQAIGRSHPFQFFQIEIEACLGWQS